MDERLPSANMKLLRANDHLETLEAEVDSWLELKPYRVWKEREPETGFSVIYAEPVGKPPIQLPAIIGDVLQNIRAGLDHIAYSLSRRGYGGDLPDNLARVCHFPISENTEKFAATCRSCVAHIDAGPLKVIESVQPYYSPRGLDRAELTLIKQLADFDKHRTMPVVIGKATMADPVTVALGELSKTHLAFADILKGKTELWRYRIVPEPELNLDDGFTFDVAFAEGAPPAVVGQRIQTVLSHLLMYVVTEVAGPLQPHLS